MLMYVKIFGERNAGTNYVQKLVQLNFHCDVLRGNTHGNYHEGIKRSFSSDLESKFISERYQDIEHSRTLASDFGWKHACAPLKVIDSSPHAEFTLFLIVAKNPYFWIRSLHQRPYNNFLANKSRSLSEFMRSRWITLQRDNVGTPVLQSSLDLWSRKYDSYLALRDRGLNVIFIRYEEFLDDFESAMRRLSVNLLVKGDQFVNFIESTKRDSFDFEGYKKKYDSEEIKEFLAAADIDYINERVPQRLFTEYGYERLAGSSLLTAPLDG